jgi:hypothetical protein
MKKLVLIAALSGSIAVLPNAAEAHGWKHHHHHHHEVVALATIGVGAGAGAVIAGPVGAVVGGVAGLFLVHVHPDNY